MKKVYVNEKWCLACHLCEYYCAFANSGAQNMAKALKNLTINPNIRIEERGDISFAVSCRHCDVPLCVKGCISGALTQQDGVISINREKCVGCYTCVLSCPYGAIMPSRRRRHAEMRALSKNKRRRAAVRQALPERRHRI